MKKKIDKKNTKKNKKCSTALYIGKFQPFHKGHLQIVKNILQKYDKVKIAIGSAQKHHQQKNPFTKEERKKMIVAALDDAGISRKKYKLFYVPDIPNDNAYPTHVQKIVGLFEKIFTGYWLNIKLFRNAGFKVHAIKRLYNISATQIRKSIANNTKTYQKMTPSAVIQIINYIDGKKRIKEIKKYGQGGI